MAPQPQLAQATAVNHPAAAAPQPQLAPMFQAQANAASGQKRLRDRSLARAKVAIREQSVGVQVLARHVRLAQSYKARQCS